MPEENVEIIRRGYEAYKRGDVAAMLEGFDPEIEIYDHDIPDSGEYRGFRVHARGRQSGVDVERVDGAVWTLTVWRSVIVIQPLPGG